MTWTEDDSIRVGAEARALLRSVTDILGNDYFDGDPDWWECWDFDYTDAGHVVLRGLGLTFFSDHRDGRPWVARTSADGGFAASHVRPGSVVWTHVNAPPLGEEVNN